MARFEWSNECRMAPLASTFYGGATDFPEPELAALCRVLNTVNASLT